MSLVITELNDGIGTIILNNDRKLNALSHALVNDVIEAIGEMEHRKARVVILRASSDAKYWCAGHDVSELPEKRRDPLIYDDPLRCLVRTIREAPFPIIAMVGKDVFGGGCEVVFACDLIVAAEKVQFAFTPAKLGVAYNMTGLVTFMNDAGLHLLKEMVFTAQPISVERFERAGVINLVVSFESLEKNTLEIARQISENAPLAITAMKAEMNIIANARSVSMERAEMIQMLRRAAYDSQDYEEGKAAVLSKPRRKPVFTGN